MKMTRIIAILFLALGVALYSVSPWLMLISSAIAWGFWRIPKLFGNTIVDKNKQVLYILSLLLVVMSMFAYLMVPLFHKMCHALDIGGKVHSYVGPDQQQTAKLSETEAYPTVSLYANAPLEVNLSPKVTKLPESGQFQQVFVLTNKLDKPLAIRVRVTLAPSSAGNFIQEKTRFNNNVIKFVKHEKKSVIIKYQVTKMPNVPSVAIAYTFFKNRG